MASLFDRIRFGLAKTAQQIRERLSEATGANVYLKREEYDKAVRVMERLRTFDPEDLMQRRDLGVALVRAGRSGAAIDHLAAYLADNSHRDDSELVQQVLQVARKEVLRWN